MQAAVRNDIPIEVSEDRLRAECIVARVDPNLLTSDNLTARLKAMGIEVDAQVAERVTSLAHAVEANELPTEPVLLAEGIAPVSGQAAWVELPQHPEDSDNTECRTDFYESKIPTVAEGQVIGIYHPSVAARSGRDVFGKPLLAAKPAQSVELGANVKLAEDGKTLVATVAGKLHVTRREVAVLEVVEIAEDVDFSTGNVDAPTDVLVNGTVRSSFEVRSPKSVAVRGAIEGARVEAGTDIQVSGGVVGQGRAHVRAGGDLFTKFCSDAFLEAQGDVTIMRECMNCRIRTQGFLHVPRGQVVGGSVYARRGAEIKILGNESERRTEVAIGVDPETLTRIAALDESIRKKRASVAKVHEKIGPLLSQLQRLSPQQREQAKMLMSQADELAKEADTLEKQKNQLMESTSPEEKVHLLVTTMIHPGVAIVFGDKMTVLRTERKGPIYIEHRIVDRVEEICAIDRCSGSVTVLPSYGYVSSELPAGTAR